jgi:hypothetical protein
MSTISSMTRVTGCLAPRPRLEFQTEKGVQTLGVGELQPSLCLIECAPCVSLCLGREGPKAPLKRESFTALVADELDARLLERRGIWCALESLRSARQHVRGVRLVLLECRILWKHC